MNRILFANNITCALRNLVTIHSTALQAEKLSLSRRMRRTGLCAALLGCLFAATANANPTYVLGSNGDLWREYGNYTNRNLVDANVHAFQALDASTVYVLGSNGELWHENGNATDRYLVDGNVAKFQGLPNNWTVFVLGTNGYLWHEDGSFTKRTFVDGNVESFQDIP